MPPPMGSADARRSQRDIDEMGSNGLEAQMKPSYKAAHHTLE
jgi:hypothetical protein